MEDAKKIVDDLVDSGWVGNYVIADCDPGCMFGRATGDACGEPAAKVIIVQIGETMMPALFCEEHGVTVEAEMRERAAALSLSDLFGGKKATG